MPYVYELYFHENKNVTIKGVWPIEDTLLIELYASAKKEPTYMAFYQPCVNCPAKGKAPDMWKLTPVLEIKRIVTDSFFTLYKVTP